jgi:hypothetical protein
MSNGNGGMSTVKREDAEASLRPSKIISSFCSADQPQCVEVEYSDKWNSGYPILVTDSKSEGDPVALHFNRDEWEAFINGVKAGEFDYDRLVKIAERRARLLGLPLDAINS